MNRALLSINNIGSVVFVILCGCLQGCTYHSRPSVPQGAGMGMEQYAEERYAQALIYMEDSRYELARQQFAIVEKTAVSEKLRQLAQEGYDKAGGVIEAKR